MVFALAAPAIKRPGDNEVRGAVCVCRCGDDGASSFSRDKALEIQFCAGAPYTKMLLHLPLDGLNA